MTTPTLSPEAVTAVAAGIAALDDHFGDVDWRARIDLDALDVNDLRQCVLGQVFHAEPWPTFAGAYEAGNDALGLTVFPETPASDGYRLGVEAAEQATALNAARLGFERGTEPGGEYDYAELTAAWRAALA